MFDLDARLTEAEAVVGRLADEFEPGAVAAGDAAVAVKRVARLLHQLQAIEMGLAKRVADTSLWQSGAATSPSDWLARTTGASRAEAASIPATAGRLESLPATAARMATGELSTAEADLLTLATRESLRGLRDECARRKAAADPDDDARYERIRRARNLRHWRDPDGTFRLSLATTPDAGADIIAALSPYRRLAFDEARRAGRRERPEAYDADAMLLMARAAATPTDSTTGSISDGTPGRPPRPAIKTIVRIDHTALRRGHPVDGEVCEITGVGPVPVSVVRTMLREDDPFVAVVLTKGVEVHAVAHAGRGANAFQQTALEWLQPTCVVRGCDRVARLENDHRLDYQVTRHTRLDELDRMCGTHHDKKSYEGWRLEPGTGKRRLLPPGHPDHPGDPREQFTLTC
jgi:hypothetical protein